MAVSKLWPVTVRLATVLDYASNPEKTTKSKSKYSDADYQALRDVVAYAKDGEKTERELFCEGIHCNPQTAREQFITAKEQFDKPDGIQAYHGYLSFEETDITPELAQQVGMAFAERMWGDRFQVLVTTHLNTEHTQKNKGRSKDAEEALARGLMLIFSDFGKCKDGDPALPEAQALVKRLQAYISENYYQCTPEILQTLGAMYGAGGEFTENIDKAGGEGTAKFVERAISIYCK